MSYRKTSRYPFSSRFSELPFFLMLYPVHGDNSGIPTRILRSRLLPFFLRLVPFACYFAGLSPPHPVPSCHSPFGPVDSGPLLCHPPAEGFCPLCQVSSGQVVPSHSTHYPPLLIPHPFLPNTDSNPSPPNLSLLPKPLYYLKVSPFPQNPILIISAWLLMLPLCPKPLLETFLVPTPQSYIPLQLYPSQLG